jgi:hypothetical protein
MNAQCSKGGQFPFRGYAPERSSGQSRAPAAAGILKIISEALPLAHNRTTISGYSGPGSGGQPPLVGRIVRVLASLRRGD